MPWRPFCVCRLEHHVPCARIFKPFTAGWQIHRAELPLANRVGNACFEPPLLFLITDFEPEFDQDDAAINNVLFNLGTKFQKPLMLLLVAKAHYIFHSGTVVPTSIKYHDFARGGKMRHVPLHVHLRFLPVRRCGQRHDAKDSWTDSLGNGPDGAPLPCSVTTFEKNDHAETLVLHPILELAQFSLKFAQLL